MPRADAEGRGDAGITQHFKRYVGLAISFTPAWAWRMCARRDLGALSGQVQTGILPRRNPGMIGTSQMDLMLGRYKLHGELGRGAMAVVHRGYDPDIGRPVALKTLREEFADRDEYRYHFLSEARAVEALTHPGIVSIFDVGIIDGMPFIAMELLEGPTLTTYVEQHAPLPLRTILTIVTQIADALDYAHRQGVVHQDIKPGNIAVTSDTGNVKVMDFGIARRREEADVPTSGPVAGTPQYMSPEQIRGAEVDGRSDLYSLGVLLYWLLAGHTPFSADNVADLLRKTLNEPPPALKPLDPATPDALLDVVRTLLAKDPADRYQSGSELMEALSRIDHILAARDDSGSGRRIVPIRVRWTAVMVLIVSVTVALGLTFIHHRQNEAMTGLTFDYGLTLTRMLASESAEDLLLDDHVALQVLVDDMARNHDIVHLAVSDRAGTVVASTDARLVGVNEEPLPESRRLLQRGSQSVHAFDADQGRSLFLFDAPVQYQEHELGRFRIGLSSDALAAASRSTLISLVAVLLATLLAVLVGAYLLSRRLTAPLQTLRNALRQITHGRLDSRIRVHRSDEFEQVFDAYNTMADSLEARRLIAASAKRLADDPRSNVDSRMSASISDTLLIDPEIIAAAEQERPAS